MSPITVSRRHRLPAVWAAVVSLLIGCLVGTPTASAAAQLDITGVWDSVYHCTVGWCAGQDFPAQLTLEQGPGGVITGTAPANVITGTLSGHSLRLEAVEGSYVADYVVTVAADGLTWTGTASDNNGTQGDSNATRRAKPPTLSISIHPTIPSGGMAIGDVLSVPVTVSAVGGDVTDVSLGKGLLLGGGAVAPSSPFPKLPTGFTLADGASRTFTYVVKAVKPGTATLTASVDGSWNSTTLHDDASKTIRTSNHQLKITVAPTPGTVDLVAGDDGKVAAKFISVRVKLANTGKTRITGVQLLSLNPVPVNQDQQLDQLAFAKGTFPLKIGTIEAKSAFVKTLKLRVTGDGDYIFNALALYSDAASPSKNSRAVAHTGAFKATVPLLYFKAAREGDGTVRGDQQWYVTGHVRNLSSFQTLCLSPLSPAWSGNAGGLGPHQIGVVPVDEPAPPLAGPLAPGKTISFLMAVHTSADGGTRSAVTLKPRATLGDPGDDCNVLTTGAAAPIPAKKIKIAKDSEDFHASIDISAGPPSGAGSLEFFGAYAKASYKVLGHLYEGGMSVAEEYGSPAKMYAAFSRLDPAAAAARAAAALGSVMHSAAVATLFWTFATPQEKADFLAKVADDFIAKAPKVWDGVSAAVQQSARGWFDSVVTAYYAGDTSALFKSLGNTAGTALTENAIEMAKFELGLALVKKSAALVKVATRVTAESAVLKALKDIPAGRLLSFEEMQNLWGLSKADFAAFKKVAQEEGVLIGVRGRSVVSVKNLEEGAVWKHENLKPKNVNDIDVEFLGFAKEDSGLVAFRTYTNKEKARIVRTIERSALDADQKAAALDRMKTRFGEKQYLSQIQGYAAKGEIDVGFNYRGNGLDVDPTQAPRRFALDAEKVSGGTYYRPLQENPVLDGLASGTGAIPKWCTRELAAILCRVTGDMDGVYVTNVGGTSVSEAQRLTIYQKLAAAGWQHPETLTWIKGDGSFFFSAKKKILAGLQLGGEAMIEFAPDGLQRATYFDLKNSFLFAKDSYYIDIVGGMFGG